MNIEMKCGGKQDRDYHRMRCVLSCIGKDRMRPELQRVLVEAELELEVEDSETNMELEYGEITYLVNDYVTLGAGVFLSPFGVFRERLHPAWINKMPDAPLALGHDGINSQSELGVQARGALACFPGRVLCARKGGQREESSDERDAALHGESLSNPRPQMATGEQCFLAPRNRACRPPQISLSMVSISSCL